jgi:hypothetical protein
MRQNWALLWSTLIVTAACTSSPPVTIGARVAPNPTAAKAQYIERHCFGDETGAALDLPFADQNQPVVDHYSVDFTDQRQAGAGRTAVFRVTEYTFEGLDNQRDIDSGWLLVLGSGYTLHDSFAGQATPGDHHFTVTSLVPSWGEVACDLAYEEMKANGQSFP